MHEYADGDVADMRLRQAFVDTSTSVAASQMRNALNNLTDTVTDASEKQVCRPFPKPMARYSR